MEKEMLRRQLAEYADILLMLEAHASRIEDLTVRAGVEPWWARSVRVWDALNDTCVYLAGLVDEVERSWHAA